MLACCFIHKSCNNNQVSSCWCHQYLMMMVISGVQESVSTADPCPIRSTFLRRNSVELLGEGESASCWSCLENKIQCGAVGSHHAILRWRSWERSPCRRKEEWRKSCWVLMLSSESQHPVMSDMRFIHGVLSFVATNYPFLFLLRMI